VFFVVKKMDNQVMARIRKKIETIITGNEQARLFSFESFLLMVSLVYGGAVMLREAFYKNSILKSKKLPCIIISIGNITVGGTGKTPMTIYMAKLIKSLGYKVAIISRGYKGGAEKTGGIVSNGHTIFMEPEKAGDEPFMMASKLKDIPVVVGQNRFEAGCLAIQEFNPDVIVLDDAFQHLNLKRDIDIVLLDCVRPFGNAHLLPRGILREPISALKRGDAFVLTRSDSAPDYIRKTFMDKIQNLASGRPVFRSFHVPNLYKPINGKKSMSGIELQNFAPGLLNARRVVAFAGLARNNDFRRTVDRLKCDLIDFFEFPDHHKYTETDLQTIIQSSINAQAKFILTTEKDYVRISGETSWPVEVVVVGIELSFGDDESAFIDFIKNRLELLLLA
jgi:tetraacyldisaccharide 4'-kinase